MKKQKIEDSDRCCGNCVSYDTSRNMVNVSVRVVKHPCAFNTKKLIDALPDSIKWLHAPYNNDIPRVWMMPSQGNTCSCFKKKE